MTGSIQLVAIDGDLHYPIQLGVKQRILLCVYPEGDCDTIKWPNPDMKNLASALFDDRECGFIGDVEVLLPDGTSAWRGDKR